MPYNSKMLTVVETPIFAKLSTDYWNESERLEFISMLAADPTSGDVVSGTGGVRKIRWTRPGSGKQGGVRVIYYNKIERGEIWLLLIYAKGATENIPNHVLKNIREELEK
jgi:hypothetical protein